MSARLAAMVLAGETEQLARGVGLRKGQAAFNALAAVDSSMAEQIGGTALDPFYDDSRINAFYAAIALDEYR